MNARPAGNHWWNVTLYPSARGLTTRRMPVEAHNLEIEIDLVDDRLGARTTESEGGFELHDGLSVADFHQQLIDTLDALDVRVEYTAPEPAGLREQALRPPTAEWLPFGTGSLAILRYDDVRSSPDPKATLLEFLQSAFEAGALLAGWDLAGTATHWSPIPAADSSVAFRPPVSEPPVKPAEPGSEP